MDYVAGYAVFNDVSERDFQIGRPGGQWLKGKSHDTFGPLGPWMVTKDEVPDPGNLSMKLTVNGKTMQQGSTRTLNVGDVMELEIEGLGHQRQEVVAA